MATQLNNEGFDTGSNYAFADKMIAPNAPRSVFDLSHLVTRDISEAGLVFPISIMETLPASDYEISVKSLVRVMPQSVPLMSRQRLYLYAFYSRCPDLWCGFDVFIRRGYSGNEVKTIPTLNNNNVSLNGATKSNPDWTSGVVSGSLGDYLGFPLGNWIGSSIVSFNINAMPFMMYARIWRDYFVNRNFYVDDRRILPDDDSRFRLLDNGKIGSFVDAGDTIRPFFDVYGCFSSGIAGAGTDQDPYRRVASKGMQYVVASGSSAGVFAVAPFYHDYPADYFTSALPWPQRGNTPTLDVDDLSFSVDNLLISDTSSDGLLKGVYGNPQTSRVFGLGYESTPASSISVSGSQAWDYNTALGRANQAFNTWLSGHINSSRVRSSGSLSGSISITLEDLRELSVSQTIMEKMARTDGSYREFGITFFGEPSKAAVDYRPTFIGGSYAQLLFSEVLQTSQTTQNSALGQMAGHGISADGNGYIGRVHTDDYGYIMILGCLMPDVYYSQGLEKLWTRNNQSDWFIPERAQLGMQPILNKELYLQPQTVVDSDNNPVNNNLFAYQDIFDEYRYKNNRIGGQVADTTKKSFYPFTQSRKFATLPNWGKEFARADDVRTDYLAAPIESAYIAQFDVNVRAVQPLPYRARPASILNGVS